MMTSRSNPSLRSSKSFSQMRPRRPASTLRNTTLQLSKLMSLRLRCKRVKKSQRKKLYRS